MINAEVGSDRVQSHWKSFTQSIPFWLSLAGVIVLHLVLTIYNLPLGVVFSGQPVTSFDYDTHYGQAVRVVEALEGWGKTWCWDPHLYAGFPNGTIFDADNKAHELFVYLLSKAGIPLPVAFNLFVLLVHLLAPFVLYLACRLAGGGRGASTTAAFLATMVWSFDSMTRWAWWVGMISYAGATVLAPLAWALIHRLLQTGKMRYGAALILLLPLVHLIHPYAFLILVVPMGISYASHFRRAAICVHVAVVGSAAATLLVNSFWLIVALKFSHYMTGSKIYGLVEPWVLLTDYLGLISNTENQALLGMRSGWRFLIWLLAVMGLVSWRKDRSGRLMPLAVGLGWLLLLSYFGKYFPITSHIQPYRHVIPLTFMAIVPGAIYLAEAARQIRREGLGMLSPALRNVMILLTAVALPHLVRDAIYFIPSLKPRIDRPEAGLPNITDTLGFGSIGWPDQQEYRHGTVREDYRQVAQWVRSRDDGSGRFLVKWWVLGEYLAWSTKAQVMGGFRHINLQHGISNIFRTYYHVAPPVDYFRRYIQTYAIKYLIVTGPLSALEKAHKELLEGHHFIPPAHRIYLLDPNPSWFVKGSGRVKASLNRIEVKEASGNEVILKYHYLENFICRPGCRVERSPIEFDPVGFIRVPNPPRNFVIENGY